MESSELLSDAFARITEDLRAAVDGLTADELRHRPDADANPIGWLAWHTTRVQDDHVAALAGRPQAWVEDGWAERFGMEPDPHDLGWGHTSAQVADVPADSPELLMAYHEAVAARTEEYLRFVDAGELSRVVDTNWDPPVTAGVRLVSVINDGTQHVGQAAYVRGLIERRRS